MFNGPTLSQSHFQKGGAVLVNTASDWVVVELFCMKNIEGTPLWNFYCILEVSVAMAFFMEWHCYSPAHFSISFQVWDWRVNQLSTLKYWTYYFICFPDIKGAWVPLEISHWIFQREGENRVRICLLVYTCIHTLLAHPHGAFQSQYLYQYQSISVTLCCRCVCPGENLSRILVYPQRSLKIFRKIPMQTFEGLYQNSLRIYIFLCGSSRFLPKIHKDLQRSW